MTKSKADQWDAAYYDTNNSYVSRLGSGVIELLAPQSDEIILDLGCGTGDLANLIALRCKTCIGLDGSADMIAQARIKYPSLTFAVADGHTFRLEKPVHAVFSNAALHWMTKPRDVVQSVRRALQAGGRFVAEFGGTGNIGAIYEAMREVLKDYGIDAAERNPWYFPGVGQYAGLLENNGFEARYMELYDRPTPLGQGKDGLAHWFSAFAEMFFEGLTPEQREEAFQNCGRILKSELFYEGQWVADYRRLRFAAFAV